MRIVLASIVLAAPLGVAPAALAGHSLAAQKVRHRGAIMPRDAGAVH